MKRDIKCAWCSQTFPPTRHDRPKQHMNGAQMCLGSGMTRDTHDQIIASREQRAEAKKK